LIDQYQLFKRKSLKKLWNRSDMLTDQSQYIKIELLNNQWIKLFMLINHSQLSELSKDQSKESFNSSETFQLINWLTDPSLLKKSSMLINQCIKIRLLRRLLKSQSFKRKLLRRLLKDQCHLFKRSLLRRFIDRPIPVY